MPILSEAQIMDEKSFDRRKFLIGGAVATAGLVGATVAPSAMADSGVRIAKVSELSRAKSIAFNFPNEEPALLLDTGKPVPGGIGPNKSIVAYSTLCQHMGCPLEYEEASQEFVCPCHASRFDPARSGMATEGPSPRGLPRIELAIRHGEIYAIGIVDGQVYGYACQA